MSHQCSNLARVIQRKCLAQDASAVITRQIDARIRLLREIFLAARMLPEALGAIGPAEVDAVLF